MISSKISLLTIGITTLYPQALGALGGHPTFLAHAASLQRPQDSTSGISQVQNDGWYPRSRGTSSWAPHMPAFPILP